MVYWGTLVPELRQHALIVRPAERQPTQTSRKTLPRELHAFAVPRSRSPSYAHRLSRRIAGCLFHEDGVNAAQIGSCAKASMATAAA
jgi:hypothetical protein